MADAAACDAINGVFDLVDIRGEVIIGEGIKDNAPGIFLGDKLGNWKPDAPAFDIALDPVDGTTNLANGLPHSISVMAASERRNNQDRSMKNLPAFYSEKLAFGPAVAQAMQQGLNQFRIDDPLEKILPCIAEVLGKRVQELVVVVLNRPRHTELIQGVRRTGSALRLISDGDIAAAVAPSLPDSGVDLYCGIGGWKACWRRRRCGRWVATCFYVCGRAMKRSIQNSAMKSAIQN